MDLRPGDVLLLFDGVIAAPKDKLMVAVVVEDGWFLRVNSRSHWTPCLFVQTATDPVFHHDSYIELRGVIEYDDSVVEEALACGRKLGRLSPATITRLREAVAEAKTLSPIQKRKIDQALSQGLE